MSHTLLVPWFHRSRKNGLRTEYTHELKPAVWNKNQNSELKPVVWNKTEIQSWNLLFEIKYWNSLNKEGALTVTLTSVHSSSAISHWEVACNDTPSSSVTCFHIVPDQFSSFNRIWINFHIYANKCAFYHIFNGLLNFLLC